MTVEFTGSISRHADWGVGGGGHRFSLKIDASCSEVH